MKATLEFDCEDPNQKEELGYLIWRIKNKEVLIDVTDYLKFSKCAYYVNNYGYVVRTQKINGQKVAQLLHREIMNCPKGMEVDHINGNRLDNRKENLRVCSRIENQRNKKLYKNNTTGAKGIYMHKNKNRNKRWQAYIKVNNKKKSLGYFLTREEAAAAYDKAALLYFKEFASLNRENT